MELSFLDALISFPCKCPLQALYMFALAPLGMLPLSSSSTRAGALLGSASLELAVARRLLRGRDDLGIDQQLHAGSPAGLTAPQAAPQWREHQGPGCSVSAHLVQCAIKGLTQFPYFHGDIFFLEKKFTTVCGISACQPGS